MAARNIPNEARTYTALNVTFTGFNVKRKPLDDVRVRVALGEAIDREAIERDVYGHVYGEVASRSCRRARRTSIARRKCHGPA